MASPFRGSPFRRRAKVGPLFTREDVQDSEDIAALLEEESDYADSETRRERLRELAARLRARSEIIASLVPKADGVEA